MPNWKKVVVSGSNAAFKSVFVTNHVTASGAVSSSNSLFFSSSLSSDTSFKTLVYDTSTGKIFHTGSYAGGGGASSSPFTAAGISGSFTEASESFSTRVTTLETSPAAGFPFAGDAVITGSLLISASNNTSSSLIVQGSGSTIFEVQGSQGQLFSITDDLIHSVLEVSDISGDTLFKVSGSGLVEIPVGDLTASSTSTASFGKFIGDGSELTNLPSSFTAAGISGSLGDNAALIRSLTATSISGSLGDNAALIRSLTATGISGSFAETSASLSSRVTDNAANLKAITSSLTTAGRMVFVGAGGTLTSEDGFTYNATTNQLAVENLIVTHLTSSFVTASRITTSGSNIFGDDTTDTQTLIGTTKITGSAQVTGSTSILGALDVIGSITASNEILIGSELNIGQSPYNGQYKGRLNIFDSNSKPTFELKPNLNTVQNTANMTMYAGLNNPQVFLVAGSARLNYIGGGLSIGNSNTMNRTNTNTTGDAKLYVAGNAQISGSVNISGSGGLSVESSGSTVFEVIGSEGTLFTVTDSLEGSIFAAKDKTGIPILEVFANTGSTDVVEVNQSNLLVDTGDVIVDTGNIKLSGSLNVTGSHINVADNSKIKLGTGGDLEIYHDGSNSYIDEVGTGTLFYRGGTQTFQNAAGTKTMLTLNAASSVDLRFNNSTKLSTTNTGIEVTGTISGSIISGSHVGDGSQLTGISAGTNFTQSLFVSPSGDNSTAVVGDMSKPFATILAATASANIGDTIIVYPGTYEPTSQIIKDHVNYYFQPGATVTGSIALMEGTFDNINVRGYGTFDVCGNTTGINVTANGHIEVDKFVIRGITTTNRQRMIFNGSGSGLLELKGTGIAEGLGARGSELFQFGTGDVMADIQAFDNTVAGDRCIDVTGAGTKTINAYAVSKMGDAVYISTANYPEAINLTGHFETQNQANKYGAYLYTGNGADIKIDAHIVGAIYSLNSNNHLTQIHGSQVCSASPLNNAAVSCYNGEHLLNQYLRCSTPTAYYLNHVNGQVTVTGTAQPEGQYKRLMDVQSGKFVWRGTSFNQSTRAESSKIEGTGTVIIDSPLFHYGATYPQNEYAFHLNSADATLEINNKLEYNHDKTGSGVINISSGRLVLDGAQIIHGGGTGSFAYAIKLNNAAHSGSIFNNSFTNLTPFGPGSFTNEIVGGGTLFESHKLY